MCHIHKIWQITRKSNGPYFPGLHAFSKVCLKLNENGGSSSFFENVHISNFYKVHRMTPNQTQGIRHQKYPPYICALYYPESHIFVRFALRSAVFKMLHMFGFCHRLTLLKVKVPHCFYFLADRQNKYNIRFLMAALFIIRRAGGVASWNFQPHMALC